MTPDWLRILASVSLVASVSCAIAVLAHVAHTPQQMWIMNVVWPATALWSGPLGLWAHVRWGVAGSKHAAQHAKQRGEEPPNRTQPLPVLVAKAELSEASPVFWFMMQLAMLAGFVTAYPFNWWLLQRGVKERM